MALELETKTYEQRLPELLAGHNGKYVLIQGTQVAGVFGSYADAVEAGYEQFDLSPFLVKRIQAVEDVQFVGRA